MKRVLVVGCGLIGTSLGLALRGQAEVLLADADPEHLSVAAGRGAGLPWDGASSVDIAVLCLPLAMTATVLRELQRLDLGCTFTHVGSVQARALAEARTLGCDLSGFCGGHPMAGKETAGPGAAEGTLFLGRTWFVCPAPESSRQARQDVAWLASAAGADPVETTPQEHDATVALVSHLPQVAASAVAARLLAGPGGVARFAGPGLVDTTRLASSPVGLWQQVLTANAAQVAPLLRDLAADLSAVAAELESLAAGPQAGTPTAGPGAPLPVTTDLLRRGNEGRALVPVKRDQRDHDLAPVRVELPDTPGRLAAVLQCAAQADVNVEDLRVDHLPGRPQGIVELLVEPAQVAPLQAALAVAGLVVLAS